MWKPMLIDIDLSKSPLNPFLLAPPNLDTWSYKWMKLVSIDDIDTQTVSISVSLLIQNP